MNKLNINIIASSSKGNCITVSDGKSTIMLDAGLRFSRIQRAVDLNEVECVLITHEHADHCKAASEIWRRGIELIMSRGTWENLPVEIVLSPPSIAEFYINEQGQKMYHQIETESFYIVPFEVEHDVAEPTGFLIESKNSGNKILYVVDAPRINFDFSGITHFIVEANFAKEILENGNYEEFVKDRIKRSHMSIENLVTFLKSSDLSKTEAIFLVHLSDSNSHERKFIEQIQQACGVPVYTDSDFVVPQQKPT